MSNKHQKKLKVIPFYYFFRAFSPVNKVLFWVLFASILSVLAVATHTVSHPTDWLTGVTRIYNEIPQEVSVKEIHAHNRNIQLNLNATAETVFFRAEPITQKPWMAVSFVVMVVLGWSAMLAGLTYFKNLVAYIGVGLFLLFMTLSGVSAQLLDTENSFFIEVGLAIIVLFPSLLFRQGVFKAKYYVRFGINIVMIGLPFLLVYLSKGWVGSFGQTSMLLPFFFILILLMLLFLSREPMNFIFYLTSNHKDKKYRLPLPWVLGLFFVLFSIEFVLLHNAMGWNFIPVTDIPLQPIHLLIPTAAFAIFTAQNLYPIAKEFTSSVGFTFTLLGMILLGMAGVAFYSGTGDVVFATFVQRGIAIFFAAGTLYQFLYVVINFSGHIQQRVNYYFLMMRPRRVLYLFVSFALVFTVFTLEMADGFRAKSFFYASLYTGMADQSMLKGELEDAYEMYFLGSQYSIHNVKAFYNMAHLAQSDKANPGLAVENYTKATKHSSFPNADLNRSNILLSLYLTYQAKEALTTSRVKEVNPYVSNNLAMMWLRENEPDSAITLMKEALLKEPEDAGLYANLGYIYGAYGKQDWSKKMLEAGLKAENQNAAVVSNALVYNLLHTDTISLPANLIETDKIGEDQGVRMNYALSLYRSGKIGEAREYLDSLLAKSETAEALLLHGMTMMEMGDVDLGISRFQYLSTSEANINFRNIAFEFLGISYFLQGVPEMAALQFSQAVKNGSKKDYLHWGEMLIDENRQDSAYQVLRMGRAEEPTLFDKVGREESMLLRAHGDALTQLMGNLDHLTKDEYVRIGRYAGAVGNFSIALNNFRTMIEADSSDATPYLEMGRIYLDYSTYDSAAVENLEFGLSRFPNNPSLKTELARAYIRTGKVSKAAEMIASAGNDPTDPFHFRHVSAQVKLAQGDTTTGMEMLEALHKERPLNTEILLSIGKVLEKEGKGFEGQNLFYEALQRNHLNKDIWMQMAEFEKIAGRPEEAGNAAVNAISLSQSAAEKLQIAQKYAEEIRILKNKDY